MNGAGVRTVPEYRIQTVKLPCRPLVQPASAKYLPAACGAAGRAESQEGDVKFEV